MKRFEDKTFLVTGASSGIGRATAIRLASEGARLRLVARNQERLAETLAVIGQGDHRVIPCDVTDEGAVATVFKELKAAGDIISGISHCAGIHWLKPLQLTDTAALREMLASHVESSLNLVRFAVSSRVAPSTGMSIVLMSSVAALKGGALSSAYAAAKGALISAARALAVELASRKFRVNVVAPGVVNTPQSSAWLDKLTPEQAQAVKVGHPLGICEPEDVAAAVAFLLSDDACKITGVTIPVDGGLSAK